MILPCIVLLFSDVRAPLMDSHGYARLTSLRNESNACCAKTIFRFYAIVLIKILDFTTVNEQWKLSDQSLQKPDSFRRTRKKKIVWTLEGKLFKEKMYLGSLKK